MFTGLCCLFTQSNKARKRLGQEATRDQLFLTWFELYSLAVHWSLVASSYDLFLVWFELYLPFFVTAYSVICPCIVLWHVQLNLKGAFKSAFEHAQSVIGYEYN